MYVVYLCSSSWTLLCIIAVYFPISPPPLFSGCVCVTLPLNPPTLTPEERVGAGSSGPGRLCPQLKVSAKVWFWPTWGKTLQLEQKPLVIWLSEADKRAHTQTHRHFQSIWSRSHLSSSDQFIFPGCQKNFKISVLHPPIKILVWRLQALNMKHKSVCALLFQFPKAK